jgi:predicted MFS family arabinose efflux permease
MQYVHGFLLADAWLPRKTKSRVENVGKGGQVAGMSGLAMTADQEAPPASLVFLLAASCGLVVANIYYAQPLVGLIAPSVHISARSASLVMTLTQLGYAAGLLLLVPLGDMLENRRLIVATIAASVPALALLGLAPNGGTFLAAAAVAGVLSVAVQMLVPMAAHLAPDAMRGRVVGTVMSGLLFGILFARPAASFIAALAGWRAVFFCSAVVMAVLAVLLRAGLPQRRPAPGQRYGALLASLFALPVKSPVLRRRALCQAACFGVFSLFWTAVPLWLTAHFGLTQRGIGVFALVGAAGALMAPLAGRLADAGHGTAGSRIALVVITLAFVLTWFGRDSVVVLAAAGVLLDAGVQAHMVFSQREIYALSAPMRSRLNGVFMAIFFVGGAIGSAAASPLLIDHGWAGVAVLGCALPLAAFVYTLRAVPFRPLEP